ncbi:MAG: Fpg/Nei family DNA glycosylase [Bacteroidetes bacterium]|nr:Fpg/Nei family DNA glycosylase [Bacteroidota bacterium]
MPELPDLEVFSANLQKRLKGKKLEALKLDKKAKTNGSPAALRKALTGQTLVQVYREGKQLRFLFKNKNILGMHLMLHGRLLWQDKEGPKPHTLCTLSFSGGAILALTDFQSAARLSLNPEEATAPDALSTAANTAFWKKALQTKATIKNVLLDQDVVRGIGNAYADEILWQARISPFSVSNRIPAAAVTSLSKTVKAVLKKAIRQIKKEQPDIIGGELRDFMQVHDPHRKTSPVGATIKKAAAGGRKTYYTAEQQLYK